MAKETLLAEQELEFTVADEDETRVVYATVLSTVPDIAAEATVTISWDGTEYTCKAVSLGDGFIAVGNLYILNAGEDSGEPFALLLVLEISDPVAQIGTLSTDPTHTVAIYKGAAAPQIVLLDKGKNEHKFSLDLPLLIPDTEGGLREYSYGAALTDMEIPLDLTSGNQPLAAPDGYLVKTATILKPDTLLPENIKSGVEIAGVVGDYVPDTEEVTVELDMTEGDQAIEPSEGKLLAKATVKKPETLVPENILQGVEIGGVVGSAVAEVETEEKTVELDFSSGDMAVEPTEGKFLSRVDIPKPETLLPENIAKDVMIAGILGTHEGSGGGGVESKFAVKSGSFKATVDGVQTITHDLGVQPEVMFLYTTGSVETSGIIVLNGYCEKIKAEQVVELKTSSGSIFIRFTIGVDSKADYSYGQFKNVNPVTFDVGGGTAKITTGITYYWTVIGGILLDNDWIILHLELDGNGNIIVTGGVPEIETLEILLNGSSVGTVDYTYSDNVVIDISSYVTEATEYTVTVQANGTALAEKYTGQYCYPVTGYVKCPSGSCGENATWVLDNSGVLTIAGMGAMYDVANGKQPWYTYMTAIKEVVILDGITSIGSQAFRGATALSKVTISDSVTSISKSAFYGCSSLTSIVIPDSVTSIANHVFYSCSSLTSVDLGNGVLSVGESSFSECSSLTSVKLSPVLNHIGPGAFRSTAIKSITIPASVTQIDYNAFYLSSLTYATFEDPVGWKVASSSTATIWTNLSSSYIASTSTAATYLKTTYYRYYWRKN